MIQNTQVRAKVQAAANLTQGNDNHHDHKAKDSKDTNHTCSPTAASPAAGQSRERASSDGIVIVWRGLGG